jgi:hypothetical protein
MGRERLQTSKTFRDELPSKPKRVESSTHAGPLHTHSECRRRGARRGIEQSFCLHVEPCDER